MFSALNSVMNSNDQIKLTITKQGDQLSVLVQSVLAELIKDSDNDQTKQIKMALATPLVVKGTADQLNESFMSQLSEFGAVKSVTTNALKSSLGSVKEASKQALQVNVPAAKKSETKSNEEPLVVQEESVIKPTQSDSLF
jgi:PRTRC genetic system protein E